MNNQLRLCVVGGRSYGKTAIVKALVQMPNCIVLNNKRASVRLLDMGFDDSEWAQTSWDDVKDWKLKWSDDENGKIKTTILSFADYAGEYFEEDYEESDGDNKDSLRDKLGKVLRRFLIWGGNKKAKRRIKSLFYHPDGVVVLLPRDFSEKKGAASSDEARSKYEGKRNIYETRVMDYLGRLPPSTPVQIVLTKWDLNDSYKPVGANLEEVMATVPFKSPCQRILNWVKSNGRKEETLKPLAISVKGRDANGNWVDDRSQYFNEAWNVRDLINRMARESNAARTRRLVDSWERANFLSRMFIMPWHGLRAFLRNPFEIAHGKILLAGMLRFGCFCAAVALAANLFTTFKTHYLENQLEEKLADPRIAEKSAWDASCDERKSRAERRLSVIEEQISRLPIGKSSAKMNGLKANTEKCLRIIKDDKDFDSALFGLRDKTESCRLRDMDRICKEFGTLSEVRTNDFVRLHSSIAELDKKLSAGLEAKMANMDKTILGDRMARYDAKLNVIRQHLENVFIEGGETYKSWESRRDELESAKASDELYDPFDKEFAALPKNDLKKTDQFLATHPRDKYPGREVEYKTIDELEKTALAQISNDVVAIEAAYADSQELPMKTRIEYASKRKEALDVALGKLRERDNEYRVFSRKAEDTQNWISGHQKYAEYDSAWKDAVELQDTEKVAAIQNFLKNHDKAEYPEYSGKIDEAHGYVVKLSNNLAEGWLGENSDLQTRQSDGSWETRVSAADKRIEKLEAAKTSLLPEDRERLDSQIAKERSLKEGLERVGKFDDAYAAIANVSSDRLIQAIMDFRTDFKISDYTDRNDVFDDLEKREKRHVERIAKRCADECNAIPPVDEMDFEGRKERSEKIRKANERALREIPSDHPAADAYENGRAEAAVEANKFADWMRLRDEKKRLESYAKETADLDEDDALPRYQQTINDVYRFFAEYPEEKYSENELHEIYEKVRDILRTAENALLNRYNKECEDAGSDATGDDAIIYSVAKRIELTGRYRDMFPVDTPWYKRLGNTREQLSRSLDAHQKEESFNSAYSKCLEIVEKPANPAEEKIRAIDNFLSSYSSPDWMQVKNVKSRIDNLEKRREYLERRQSFDELVGEKEKLTAQSPTGDEEFDGNLLISYIGRCEELKEKFNDYTRQARTRNEANNIIEQLDEQIKLAKGKMGDGSWSDISKKEEEYKSHPSRSNYRALMEAIALFEARRDSGSAVYAKRVKECKEKAENDRRLADNVINDRDKFSKDSNQYNSLLNTLESFRKNNYRREDDPLRKACLDFLREVELSRIFQTHWELLGFDFKDTDYERTSDYRLEIFFDGQSVVYLQDIHDAAWTPKMHYKGKNGKCVSGDKQLQSKSTLQIIIKHPMQDLWWWVCGDPNYISIPAIELLSAGCNDGEWIKDIQLIPNAGKKKQKPAVVQIKFSNIPHLIIPPEELQ